MADAKKKLWLFWGLFLAGALFVAVTNQFSISVPVVVLVLGWLSLLWGIFTVWRASDLAVVDSMRADWWLDHTPKQELLKHKAHLLRAIKEIEFDRDMGKVSQEEADELSRSYREEAIAVLRKLDEAENSEAQIELRAKVEKELARRQSLAVKTTSKKKGGAK